MLGLVDVTRGNIYRRERFCFAISEVSVHCFWTEMREDITAGTCCGEICSPRGGGQQGLEKVSGTSHILPGHVHSDTVSPPS